MLRADNSQDALQTTAREDTLEQCGQTVSRGQAHLCVVAEEQESVAGLHILLGGQRGTECAQDCMLPLVAQLLVVAELQRGCRGAVHSPARIAGALLAVQRFICLHRKPSMMRLSL